MNRIRTTIKSRPGLFAAIGTLIGYVAVLGTFAGLIPIYPEIGLETSTQLSHAIAIVNAATIISLLVGWYWIRNGAIFRHRAAMGTAFSLILLFLVLYLLRVGGGGTKEFVGPTLITYAYLLMLAIHIALSILAVPLVLDALILGITHTPAELRRTSHARVGQFAAGSWLLSLVLGLVTYVMLEHLYSWEWVTAVML